MGNKNKAACINCRFGAYWEYRNLSANTTPLVEGKSPEWPPMPATGQCCRYAPGRRDHDPELCAPVLSTHWCGDHRWKNKRWWQR